MSSGPNPAATVAAVLPGGGARGAYEAGALSVLLPALEARGERVSIWCGTSVGAINATAMASLAHLPVAEQTRTGVKLWAGLRKGDVIAPIFGSGGLRTAVRVLGHGLRVPGLKSSSARGGCARRPGGVDSARYSGLFDHAPINRRAAPARSRSATAALPGRPAGRDRDTHS